MIIQQVNESTPAMSAFWKQEWTPIIKEYFGKYIDYKIYHYYLLALEKDEIIGIIELRFEGNVFYIEDLIVAKRSRKRWVGRRLIEETEKPGPLLNSIRL